MKIGILTSSRADYSIYYPLLKALQNDDSFNLNIIAFGTHLSGSFGRTVDNIISDGFPVSERVETMPLGDQPKNISSAMGKAIDYFSDVWSRTQYDLVFCIGDRYEMFAACSSTVPFDIKLAHIHGGEETTGAIDNVFRHAITSMSEIHFPTTSVYADRIAQIKGAHRNIFNVGALSIDNLKNLSLLSIEAIWDRFRIDLSKPSILVTFHPETVAYSKNALYINEVVSALKEVEGYQLLITMPNADTMSNVIRNTFLDFSRHVSNVTIVESLGTIGYLSCMKYCAFMLGNTSSGFVEASFFPKYVINLGERQTGRLRTPNILDCRIEKKAILSAIHQVANAAPLPSVDVYGTGNAAEKIVKIIKKMHA
jgi:GDP/UDP-N,N'-diacetylbacillosamine 2-epimerase (hydrolysing)